MMGDYYNPNNFGACDNRFIVDDIDNTFNWLEVIASCLISRIIKLSCVYNIAGMIHEEIWVMDILYIPTEQNWSFFT